MDLPWRPADLGLAFCLGAVVAIAPPALAGDPPPFSAREGESLVRDAADAWAGDAELVYIENDEALSDLGRAERWGYLFYSEQRGESRAYSVRDGKIRTATDLSFDLPAPPLAAQWIDSGRALAIADEKKGDDFRAEHAGRLRTMLLVRGLLDLGEPDRTAWAVVYESEQTSSLWVVVDATTGKVVKTWRG